MTGAELIHCRQADILACDADSLADIREVRIPTDLPLPQRTLQYLEQIHNPYLFRVEKLTVKVSFGGNQDLSSMLSGLMTQ